MPPIRRDKIERFAADGYLRHVLVSYAYNMDLFERLAVALGPELCSRMDILVDSGAFTVMTKGVTIDVVSYADFLDYFRNRYNFHSVYAFNLDVIPVPTSEELTVGMVSKGKVDQAAELSWKNYLYLTQERKLDFVVPVFHYGEDSKWVQTFVDSGCKYFAFGGVSGRVKSPVKKKQAVVELFKKLQLYNYDGWVHMLGLCMPDILCSHGWHSVDATITKAAAYGSIYVFDELSRMKLTSVPITPTNPRTYQVLESTRQSKYLETKLEQMGMGGIEIERFQLLSEGVWLRIEACLRAWTLFEDWLNSERKRLGRNFVYDVAVQGDFEEFFKQGCENG
jgi:hypothetical protein